ncbi:MAG: outer membrane protein assembly factor BamD [Candidatus Omnitrophica bacterium]|nr:outer membrane protein assembly factor BamD [Candidatus Omnitrophota bacterium]
MKNGWRFFPFFLSGALAAGAVFPPTAAAAWIWTPQTRRWVNPKYTAKDTPRAQMDWAVGFFETKEYARAMKEFVRLVKTYPRSELAPEAQYLTGVSYEMMDRPAEAFGAYKKLVEIYPFSARFKDATEREFAIGELFFSGKRLRLIGPVSFPSLDKAIEVYEHIVSQAPYGDYGAQAQFRLGECYRKQKRFEEASRAFQKVLDEYPNSLFAEQAKYNVAFCAYQMSLKPSYDQSATDEAINWYETFISTHPESELIPEAKESLAHLKGFKAQGLSQTAHFYEIQGKKESALFYYRQILKEYPDSTEAAQAVAKIAELEPAGGAKQ